MPYVRFESAAPGPRGSHAGLFALANGLARAGRLSAEDWAWWRTHNDWYERELPNPATADPTLFDRAVNPFASSWFKAAAGEVLQRTAGYLELLDRYGVPWRRRRSANPGEIRYEDAFQIVVVPNSAADEFGRRFHV